MLAHHRGRKEEYRCVVDATIVSHHFWPPLQDDDLQVVVVVVVAVEGVVVLEIILVAVAVVVVDALTSVSYYHSLPLLPPVSSIPVYPKSSSNSRSPMPY